MTDRNRSQNYYERENYNTFQDHGIRRNSKDCYEDRYRNENFYDNDKSYDTDSSYSRDRAYNRNRSYNRDRDSSQEYKRDNSKDRSYGRDRSQKYYDPNHSCRRDRLPEYITKIIMKESIIIHFRTMEIGENIKIIIKTNIGMKISMIVIDLMIWIILMVEIGYIVETDHIVEIDHETTVEMSIRRKVINIREGLEIIMQTSMRTDMVWINMNANSEMTIMT